MGWAFAPKHGAARGFARGFARAVRGHGPCRLLPLAAPGPDLAAAGAAAGAGPQGHRQQPAPRLPRAASFSREVGASQKLGTPPPPARKLVKRPVGLTLAAERFGIPSKYRNAELDSASTGEQWITASVG